MRRSVSATSIRARSSRTGFNALAGRALRFASSAESERVGFGDRPHQSLAFGEQ